MQPSTASDRRPGPDGSAAMGSKVRLASGSPSWCLWTVYLPPLLTTSTYHLYLPPLLTTSTYLLSLPPLLTSSTYLRASVRAHSSGPKTSGDYRRGRTGGQRPAAQAAQNQPALRPAPRLTSASLGRIPSAHLRCPTTPSSLPGSGRIDARSLGRPASPLRTARSARTADIARPLS